MSRTSEAGDVIPTGQTRGREYRHVATLDQF
jgi:hypothetical protein